MQVTGQLIDGSRGSRVTKCDQLSALEPGHFSVRKPSSQVTGCTFFLKKVDDFLVVDLKTQAANAADCFTVKIKQIKPSDVLTFLFSVHTITEAKQIFQSRH